MVTALFTSTSAVCVTGLVVVDTGTYWSGFGEGVILALIQVGGFGIMTLASLLALLASGKLGLRMQLTAQAETKSLGIGDVRRVLLGVAGSTLIVELAVGAFLSLRFRYGYGNSIGDAAYLGFFHAVSAFNNAGFGLHADSLTGYAQDPWVTLPIAVAVILGGLGFPVLLELLRHRTRRRTTGRRTWSLHTKLTLVTTAALLVVGMSLTSLLEWENTATLGSFDWIEKLLNGFFHSAMSRTAGFNALDVGAMHASTLLVTCMLMFIGGGSAGTAGGIKVGTFAVLAAAMLAEVRGEPHAAVLGRYLHSLRRRCRKRLAPQYGRPTGDRRVAVIGLGRFGISLANELMSRGWDVLGIDTDAHLVQKYSDSHTHAAVADCTDPEVLRQLGVTDFTSAVVGIGTDIEASILITSNLLEAEVPNIWAKAVSRQHGQILERLGTHHVVLPEHDMGERVAHLVTGRMLDFIPFDDDYALVKTVAPEAITGLPLGESHVRSKYGVTVVGIKRAGEAFTYATAETVVVTGDVIIVTGRTQAVEAFAELS
ncbi:anion-transporting ATPase [Streptomyces sp. NBRC 110611]|nr:anion-transporting ATPase [Streptomyces sp. NBRC 110611]